MNRLQAACRRALCLPIRAYQYTLSPWIGRSCRFTPSCSNYTMQAILTHGCIKVPPQRTVLGETPRRPAHCNFIFL